MADPVTFVAKHCEIIWTCLFRLHMEKGEIPTACANL